MALLLKMMIFSIVLMYKSADSAPRVRRLSLAESRPSDYYYYNQGYGGTYSFGYDVSEPKTGNVQFRKEERYPNGTVAGSYGYLDPLGRTRSYQYIADENGYRVINKVPEYADKVQIFNNQKASTDSTITWTRSSKPKRKKTKEQVNPNASLELKDKKHYFEIKPPSYYAID